jgi:SAM-dependent methyltransferase
VAQVDRVAAVEAEHWWFATTRRAVVGAVTDRLTSGLVVDVGCGTAHVLAGIPDRFERVGVDADERSVQLARERTGLRIEQADVLDLPFDDGSVDAAICVNVIGTMGVADDAAAVRELRRVLRPRRGVLVLMVGAYDWLRSGHDEVAQNRRRFTRGEVRRLLAGAGMAADVRYRVASLLPVAVVQRLVVHRGEARSDVGEVSPAVNAALTRLVGMEDRVMRFLPFCLSVLAIAETSRPAS